MKIGMLTAYLSRRAGGVSEAVRRLARSVANAPGADVAVFGLADAPTPGEDAWGDFPTTAVAVQGPGSFGFSSGLATALVHADLDLLHTHGLWMYPSVASAAWSRTCGKPYVVAPHGMLDPWALRNGRWKKMVAGWLYEHGHLRRAACLHALCEAEARAIRACGLRNPICIVPNALDLAEEPIPDDDGRRDRWSDDRSMLLYLGRLHPKKNLPSLLYAWSRARASNDPAIRRWRLAIAGWDQDGHADALRKIAAELELGDSVDFLGPRFGVEKQALYRAASALVLPSLSEGLPMVVLEAWSYGLPVLMTPECNLPEGFAADAAIAIDGTPAGIAKGLAALSATSEAQRTGLGRNGRRLLVQRFSPEAVAGEMRAVYRWLLGGGAAPGCVVTT